MKIKHCRSCKSKKLKFVFSLGKIQLNENFHIYSISVFSTAFLALIRDSNLLTGLRYFRGGADGLWHQQ